MIDKKEGLQAILETIDLVGEKIENHNNEIQQEIKSLKSLKTLVMMMIKQCDKEE